jgi:hypothetical protein
MAEPSLHLGDVGSVVQGVGGGGCPQAVRAELGGDPRGLRILPERPVIYSSSGS